MAFAFRLFLNANGVVGGGVVGLSTILQSRFGWEPALTQWAINLPLVALGFGALGRADGVRSVVGSLALPTAILVTRDVRPMTHEPLLAAVFGGLLYGTGLGLVLWARGSVGGFSLVARIVARRLDVKPPTVIFALDTATILGSAWIFGPDRALYGLLAAYLMRRAIERALLGFSKALLALVISERGEEIRPRILHEMDRGLTVLPGVGGYSGTDRPVLMVVLGQSEIARLRRLVQEVDPEAFVVITDVSEVVGHGFSGREKKHLGDRL